jgi:Lar family restriction alleviation protein
MEAIGVKMGNIDTETGAELSHYEVYGRAIELLGGLDAVKPYIPFSIPFLRERYKEDYHFNNTQIAAWDYAAGFEPYKEDVKPTGKGLWALYRKAGIDCVSCSEGVCILKEAARRLIETDADIRPCPFCGGEAKVFRDPFFVNVDGETTTDRYQVLCIDCNVSTWYYDTEQAAIDAWNKRVTNEQKGESSDGG